MRKIFLFIIFIYILVLLQTSFFVHFNTLLGRWVGWSPNFILILVVLINLLEKPKGKVGLWLAGIAGFFLDIFSTPSLGINFIGFYILILLLISFFIKIIFKKYFQLSLWKNILETKK